MITSTYQTFNLRIKFGLSCWGLTKGLKTWFQLLWVHS